MWGSLAGGRNGQEVHSSGAWQYTKGGAGMVMMTAPGWEGLRDGKDAQSGSNRQWVRKQRSQVVKHQQRTDTQQQLRHSWNMTARDLLLWALLGNTSPWRMHTQPVSGLWWTDLRMGVIWRREEGTIQEDDSKCNRREGKIEERRERKAGRMKQKVQLNYCTRVEEWEVHLES